MAYTPDETERTERRQLYAAVGFFALSLVLLNLPGVAQQRLATALRATILRPFVTMQRVVTGARLRSAETEVLRAQVDSLATLVANTGALAEENLRLRGLLALRERLGTGFVPASAFRSGTPGSESVFHLDAGSAQGVRINAPVLVPEGVVGKVVEVRPRESIAMDWTHPDFRVSAMTLDGQVYGLVEPDRGIFRESDRLLLNGIPFYAELDSGVPVVTSGRGGVFPRGIAIGTVLELNEAGERWRRSYWLRPAARPGAALHVLVMLPVSDSTAVDLAPVFHAAPDSATADSTAADTTGGGQGPPSGGPPGNGGGATGNPRAGEAGTGAESTGRGAPTGGGAPAGAGAPADASGVAVGPDAGERAWGGGP